MVLSDWRPLSITHHLLLQLDVGLAVVLDVDVGFSPPVGVLRHFVQSDVVNQEVGVGVGTLNSDQGVAGFCKIAGMPSVVMPVLHCLLLLVLVLVVVAQERPRGPHIICDTGISSSGFIR